MYLDKPGTVVEVTLDPRAYILNQPAGVLVIHNHNSSGAHDEILGVSYH